MNLTCVLPVELPGIEPATEMASNCENAESDDAKVRDTTCGYAEGVDRVKHHFGQP